MKRKAKDWLMQLKDEHRDMAIANLEEGAESDEYRSLSNALAMACRWWRVMPHGYDYWREIHDSLENGTYFDAPQQTDESCKAKAKEYLYGTKDTNPKEALFPEDDDERQKYPFAQTDLFFPDADAAFSKMCLVNQQKHCPEVDGVTWASDKSIGDGSQLRRHLLEFLKAVQDGDMETADREIKSIDWRGRELHQRWIKKMPPFNHLNND